MRTTLFLLAMSLLPASAEELRLEEAIQLALKHNADIVNAQIDVERAGDKIAAFRTKLLPNTQITALGAQQLRPIDFTIDRGQLGDFASTGPIPSNDIKLTTPLRPTGMITSRVAQPLSGIYKVKLNLRLLDISKRLAEEQARAKRHDVVQTVEKLYYEIQQAESYIKVTREMARLFQETSRLTASYVVQQVALESDHLEAQTNLAKAEQDELTYTNQAASAKEQLNQLLGREVTTEFTVSPALEAADFHLDLAMARRQALEQRPEVRQSQLKVEQAKRDLRVKRAEYIPDVNAEFNSTSLLNYSSFLPSQTASVGVSLTWEPFDWGRKKHEAAEKQRAITQAKNTEGDTRNKVLADVDDKFRKLQQVGAQFRVAGLSQKTAAEKLRVANRKYQVQSALLRNVLESQASLEQANSDYAQALTRLWTAKAEFDHAIGEE